MLLALNVDHVAVLRQARKTLEPDPVDAAFLAELAGADGITVHLRGDRRHIQERDIEVLMKTIKTRLNIEMAATDEMVQIASHYAPHSVTIVPERQGEITTEGGLDVLLHQAHIERAAKRLNMQGILVSIFVNPDPSQIKGVHKAGAAMVELNTNSYSQAKTENDIKSALASLQESAKLAHKLGLRVLAGHAINYRNVKLVCGINEIVELNIGQAIIARGVLSGIGRAVREMKALIQ